MTPLSPELTVDEAVDLFFSSHRAKWGTDYSGDWHREPESAAEREARLFGCAEEVLRLLCPDPRGCTDRRCRRLSLCRHFADLRARQRDGRSPQPRRTPGAAALRHAIWLYVNACRA